MTEQEQAFLKGQKLSERLAGTPRADGLLVFRNPENGSRLIILTEGDEAVAYAVLPQPDAYGLARTILNGDTQ